MKPLTTSCMTHLTESEKYQLLDTFEARCLDTTLMIADKQVRYFEEICIDDGSEEYIRNLRNDILSLRFFKPQLEATAVRFKRIREILDDDQRGVIDSCFCDMAMCEAEIVTGITAQANLYAISLKVSNALHRLFAKYAQLSIILDAHEQKLN